MPVLEVRRDRDALGGDQDGESRRIAAKEEEEEEKEGTILDFCLYLVVAVPIFITIFAVGIMFVNSLQ